MLNNIYDMSFQNEKRNFVSPSGHVISSTCEDTKFSRESLPDNYNNNNINNDNNN